MKRSFILLSLLFMLYSLTACRQRLANHAPIEETTAPETSTGPMLTLPPEAYTTPFPTLSPEAIMIPIQTPPPVSAVESALPKSSESLAAKNDITINMTKEESFEVLSENALPGKTDEIKENRLMNGEYGESSVVLPKPADSSGITNLSDDGNGAIGMIVDNYTQLLGNGLGALYECEKGYIYFECTTNYLTVNRLSIEHKLMIESGGYNVAEKLSNNALVVDSGWVLRKNPTVMVKCVGSDILGNGIISVSNAETVVGEIIKRPGLEGVAFIINRNVCLISEELLATDDGRLLAKIYIANAMYPSLFSRLDITNFCRQIRDSGGTDYTGGIYVYTP